MNRLLAAAIGVIPLPAANTDRAKQRDLCSHMNRRHKAAQYAQRASVNLYTLLFFRGKVCVEEAYILTVTTDRISVMVPRYILHMHIMFYITYTSVLYFFLY